MHTQDGNAHERVFLSTYAALSSTNLLLLPTVEDNVSLDSAGMSCLILIHRFNALSHNGRGECQTQNGKRIFCGVGNIRIRSIAELLP
jgi:hypothetical protein